MARVMSKGLRVGVPLKSMCSMKWEIPAVLSVSWREPLSTNSPTATLSASHGASTTRIPFFRVARQVPAVDCSILVFPMRQFYPFSPKSAMGNAGGSSNFDLRRTG